MAKSSCTFSIKTPKKTYTTNEYTKSVSMIKEETEKNIAEAVLKRFIEKKDVLQVRRYIQIATFFQRVVSRTPLDEKYLMYTTEEGNRIYHIPDKDRCRYDWYITDGAKKITSAQMFSKGVKFHNVDNNDDINKISNIIESAFSNITKITIGNDNKHFGVLEYGGGYKWPAESDPKKGSKYEHGVKNNHSVQAPVGMMRISLAEFEKGNTSKVASNQYLRGHKRGMKNKIPTEKQLTQFWKYISTHTHFTFEDIKRFTGDK